MNRNMSVPSRTNFGSRVASLFLVVLVIMLFPACRTKTNEVPIGQVGVAFTISIVEREWFNRDGNPYEWRSFLLRGNVFWMTKDGDVTDLELAANERLALFDGESEYDLKVRYTTLGGMSERNPYYLSASEGNINDAAPYYILRYYRRDGAVLESRIETPVVPDFIAPERDSVWLSREQALTIEWTETAVPVEKVELFSACRAPDGEGQRTFHFPIENVTRLDIDLTGEPHKDDCETRRTIVHLIQAAVSASHIDSGFVAESRFELRRERERELRERT